MRTPCEKLEDLARIRPSLRRTERARAILLQAPQEAWDEASQCALRLGLLDAAEVRRVRLVRETLGTNPRWGMLALGHLAGVGDELDVGEGHEIDGDEDDGTVWVDPDDVV